MKKAVKNYRYNYVMTEKERLSFRILLEHQRNVIGHGVTMGSIMRKLVADEVKRIKNSQ